MVKEQSNKHFMIMIGVLALLYSIHQFTMFIINKNKIAYTDGIILKLNTAVPETMKKNNSKWAIVSYKVDGKEIISENKIQVSMNSNLGDSLKIVYYVDNRSKLFTATLKKAIIFLGISVISCIIAIFVN